MEKNVFDYAKWFIDNNLDNPFFTQHNHRDNQKFSSI